MLGKGGLFPTCMSVVEPDGADRGRDGEGDTDRVSSLSISTGLLYLTRENEVEASDSPIVPTCGLFFRI